MRLWKTSTIFTGIVPQKKRQENRREFRDHAQFLVANKTCGAFGLNLQFCHNVIFYDNDFDLATRMQAEDRVHRIGQTQEVRIYDIYAEDSIDEFILDCLDRKEGMVDAFKRWINKWRETAMTLRNLLNKSESLEKEEMQYGLAYYQEVLISAFLVTLLRICVDSDIKYISRRRKELMMDDVFVYIRENLAGDLSLQKLESVFFVSKEHLCRRFRQQTGVSIHQYILDARLSKSQSFIRKGLSISEIYKQCGFKSYTHFFKAFKKVYGCTPSQFRKMAEE